MAKPEPAKDLVRYLERRPEPARAGFLTWLEGLAAFGHEAPVRAALALARSTFRAREDELANDGAPPIADPRPATALAAVEAWLGAPTEPNVRACSTAAEAAARCAEEANEVFQGTRGRTVRDRDGDAVEVKFTRRNRIRVDDACRLLAVAKVCSHAARLVAEPAGTRELLDAVLYSDGRLSSDLHPVVRDELLAWARGRAR